MHSGEDLCSALHLPPRKPVLQVPRKKRYTSRKIGRMIGLRLVVS